jgi:hypothetical protein
MLQVLIHYFLKAMHAWVDKNQMPRETKQVT